MSEMKLLPCPFHKDKKPILVYVGEGPSSIAESEDDYREGEPGCAQCDCGAVGPTDYSFDGCITAWNTRVDPQRKALVDALNKFADWFEAQATRDESQADSCRFESLNEAYRADAKNYRAMAKHARKAIADAGEIL